MRSLSAMYTSGLPASCSGPSRSQRGTPPGCPMVTAHKRQQGLTATCSRAGMDRGAGTDLRALDRTVEVCGRRSGHLHAIAGCLGCLPAFILFCWSLRAWFCEVLSSRTEPRQSAWPTTPAQECQDPSRVSDTCTHVLLWETQCLAPPEVKSFKGTPLCSLLTCGVWETRFRC